MFLKNVFSYSLVNFYAQGVRLLQELGVRFLLPPEVLGMWSLIQVVQSFCLSFDWGILTASSRELPLMYGAARFQDAADYRRTAFYLHILSKWLISAGIIIYGAYYYLFPFQSQFLAVLAAALIFCCSGFGEAFVSFYQSAQQYVALSKKLFIYWTIYAVLLVIGAYCWAVKGLIVAAILSVLVQAIMLRNSLDYMAAGHYARRYIKDIVGFALPFRAVDFPISIAATLDAVIVARWFDLKVLAIYTTAKLIFNQAGQVPTWIGSVFISRMTTLAGGQNTREQLGAEMLFNLTMLNLILLPMLISIISLATYWGVSLWLPNYADALVILPILLISLYFQPRVTVIRNYWIIDKKFGWIAASNVLVLALMAAGFGALYFYHAYTLKNIALIYTCSFGGYFLFVLIRLGIELWGMKKWLFFMIETSAALSLLIFAINWAGLLEPAVDHSGGMMVVMQSVLRCMGIVVLMALYGAWRLGIRVRRSEKPLASETV